jgi:3-oxoacyl-[acyl-carrier-protein] synthase-3
MPLTSRTPSIPAGRAAARSVRILSTGKYLPPHVVTSEQLDDKLKVPPGTVAHKSGVSVRHVARDETMSQMAAKAARAALARAGLEAHELDAIVCGSGVIEQPIPNNASLVQRELGLESSGIPAFDVNSTCLGFVSAFDTAANAIALGQYDRVLVVASDVASAGINWNHFESATLFGDGAAAVVLARPKEDSERGSRVLASRLETYSAGADHCRIAAGGSKRPGRFFTPEAADDYLFHMDGPNVFRMALQTVPKFFKKLLEAADTTPEQLAVVVPHQASGAAVELLRRKLEVPEERWVNILRDHGNCIAASIPMALHEAIEQGRLRRGDRAMLLGTSAGFSVGGIVFEY